MKEIGRRKIGLALGSGGPRGLAHIGIIKVFEKNNIPIDFIAGSSIGAMIGGFYATMKDINQVEDIALSTDWRLIFSLLDPSFRQGLLVGKKVKNFIERYVNGIHFDNLKIPLSVVATNMRNGDIVIINEGEVASAIRASISFPLVFKPVKRGNTLLADGGLSMPVPVDVVRKMGADVVIAVNLDYDRILSRSDDLMKFGFFRIANSSINLLRHHLANSNVKDADFIINPQTGITHWGKFLDGKDIILSGEKAAKNILPQLKKILQRK